MLKRRKIIASLILVILLSATIMSVVLAGTWTKEDYYVYVPGYGTVRETDSELYAIPDNEVFLARSTSASVYYLGRAYCSYCNTSASDSFYVFLGGDWYYADIYFDHTGGCPLQLQLTAMGNNGEYKTGEYAIYEY
ncbi:MAG: hypothetical protein AB1Z23_09435 [Eubacteriales bacterium]